MLNRKYKFLIIGLGSMGKRRIRNLLFNNVPREWIFGFDLNQNRTLEVSQEYKIETYTNFQQADDEVSPDAYIISTPPNLHHDYFLHAARKKKHFFVEVPTDNRGYRELKPLLDNSFVAAPSCTFRYFPAVVKIKQLIKDGAIGKPMHFNHYLGQYLPDWHPYEDYRHVYFAQKETGGCKEMFPYELVWLTDVFESPVKSTEGIKGKISDLEMSADDIYSAVIKFKNGVIGNMLIDLLNRKAGRTLEIIGDRGTLEWDWLGKKITLLQKGKETEIIDLGAGKKIGQYNTGEEAYESEIKDFLLAIQGIKEFPYTFGEDENILKNLDSLIDIVHEPNKNDFFIEIGNRKVGAGYPPLVIADIGINHEGSLKTAFEIVDAAHEAGAEIIKHQTHVVEDEMTREAKKVIPGNSDDSIYEIMERCALSEQDEIKLKDYVESKGMIFLSTPFSRAAADRLERMGVKAYKIGSGECNNYPLIRHIASFGKPMIISTGMNDMESVKKTVEIVRSFGVPFALLHTTNLYPTPSHLVRLGGMQALQKEFPDVIVGLSDHTVANLACFAATALGADILERHFIDRMDRPGPDIANSMDGQALKELIFGSREIAKMRGGKKQAAKEEQVTIDFAFATVVTIKEIKKGEMFTKDNIWVKRPGTGEISAEEFDSILGKYATEDIDFDVHLNRIHVSNQ